VLEERDAPTLVMGILNATDDSFAGDGFGDDVDALVASGVRMAIDGADWLDVGAASSRPGHADVSEKKEIARSLSAVTALSRRVTVSISIDTTRPAVARACLAAGATMVNDVSGLADEHVAMVAAESQAKLILVHSRPSPRDRAAREARPEDVVAEVRAHLADVCMRAERCGVPRERLLVDPGLGFAKTPAESFALIRRLDALTDLAPVVVGPSRKGHLGAVTGKPVGERVFATAGAVASAILAGARMVRVHDVAQMVDVARVVDAVRGVRSDGPSRVAFVGLGANLGDRRTALRRAVGALGGLGTVRAVSAQWETAPQIVEDQPAFLNAVVAIAVPPLPVGTLVSRLKEIECELGRVAGPRYGPREIDLDLLLFARSSEVEVDGEVVVPHARLTERRFALAPLAEIAPDEREPRTGLPIRELLARVAGQPAVRIDGGSWWKTASS